MMQDKTSIGISDTFREFIEALVEEVVINGESFDAQKKWLRKNSEAEGLNYETLESNLSDLFDSIKELEEHESKSTERFAMNLAQSCYFSETEVKKLIENAVVVRAQREVEKKVQEEKEHNAKEEAERIEKERLAAERKAKREAQKKAREKAEREAKEAAERKAREDLEKKQTTGKLNGHEWVDLGLPSGTLWATCNIGSTTPEDFGDYFAWGETRPKTIYDWETYKYGHYDNLTKYDKDWDKDSVHIIPELQSIDDAATANWGSGWRTPSEDQWGELLANTTHKWTTNNEVQGELFTAKNGQTLFFPATGFRTTDLYKYETHYMSRTRSILHAYDQCSLRFDSDECERFIQDRCYGLSVRPVCSSSQD